MSAKEKYETTADRIKRNLDIGRGMRDGPEPDYSKLDDVEYGDTVAIEWGGELLEGVTDYGYVFCWPDIEADDANMGGVIHIPYPENPGGKDRADAEWVTWYELGVNPLVKKVRRVTSWRDSLRAAHNTTAR